MVVINCLWRIEDFCCVTIKSLPDSPVRLFHILIHSPHWLLIDSQFSIVSLLKNTGVQRSESLSWVAFYSSFDEAKLRAI